MLNNKKPVLCEKPLGVNVKQTKEIIECAKENNVFLMEGMWARFQPSYQQLREELDKNSIGQVISSFCSFGKKIETVERLAKKDMGGGTILDLGVYCVFFSQWVFNGEKPQKVMATGHLNADGVDESVTATLLYTNGRSATFQTHMKVNLPCEGQVYGKDADMKLGWPFWCSQVLSTPKKLYNFSLPVSKHRMNFEHSEALAYEAHHVRECLKKGLKDSDKFPMSWSLMLAEIMEDIRKQVGVSYPQDD